MDATASDRPSAPGRGLEDEAAPPRRSGGWRLAFAVMAAPLAWFVQLDANYGLFALPCFSGPDRNRFFPGQSQWVWAAAIAVYLVCLAIAIAAALASLRIYRRAAGGGEQGSRDCFLGLAGIMLGVTFAATIFVNGLAMLMVPPCAL